jgi:hypothetical protein
MANEMRKISPTAGTDECMDLANTWVSNCITNHPYCPASSNNLPTRVIRVGSEHIDPVLHISGTDQGRYVTLSHCWGSSQLLTTTIATLEKRKQGVPMTSLPKTFQDAISTTRRLGLEYIWIDSLCIVQDSAEDWARESANMAAIYSGAVVCIAADAAQSSADGCFGPFLHGPRRNLSVAIPCVNDQGLACEVYAREVQSRDNLSRHCEHQSQDCAPLPLSLRGWVRKPPLQHNRFVHTAAHCLWITLTSCSTYFRQHFDSLFFGIADLSFALQASMLISEVTCRVLQERLLAPRILHYGFHELSWECWTKLRCECTTEDRDITYDDLSKFAQYRVQMIGELSLTQSDSVASKNSEEPLTNYRGNWYRLVDNFTNLQLTYQSDRLAALSGLAEKFHGASDEYICGLWRSDFLYGLSWCVYHRPDTRKSYRQETYQAPSWSWASVTGETKSGDYMDASTFEEVLEILNIEYTLATSNPYGSVSNASITVRGFIFSIEMDAEWCIHLCPDGLKDESSHQESRTQLGTMVPDVQAGEMGQHATITQEPLLLCILLRGYETFRSCGIVLRAMGDASQPRTFQRIGLWNPDWCPHIGRVILDVLCDTAERQVFKIV